MPGRKKASTKEIKTKELKMLLEEFQKNKEAFTVSKKSRNLMTVSKQLQAVKLIVSVALVELTEALEEEEEEEIVR